MSGFADLAAAHDRAHMAAEARTASMVRFLDELTVDQLMSLRDVLNLDPESPQNSFVDGMCHALLRRVHQVDPDTGQSLEDVLSDTTGGAR